ncbi:MAG: SAM-dependent methyltransferase [Pseudomonadota bacterium]
MTSKQPEDPAPVTASCSEAPTADAYAASYRRDTPLAHILKHRIRANGPMSVAEYMSACLHHPEHGYYKSRPAIGSAGDLITAPEISQIFGELIGLWAAATWQQWGGPVAFNLIELGPGRGTLMADALRATRVVPGFNAGAHVTLVETNADLRQTQQDTLCKYAGSLANLQWTETFTPASVRRTDEQLVPSTAKPARNSRPTILIANEFLDVLPIRQFVRRQTNWHERQVHLDENEHLVLEHLVLNVSTQPGSDLSERIAAEHATSATSQMSPKSGDIFEQAQGYDDIAKALADTAQTNPVAALFIDYGSATPRLAETLQAVRNHRYEDPLTSPGEADLTAQVNFAAFAQATEKVGLTTDGPVPQATFLGALGMVQRASKLMAANPDTAHEIEAGVARLMAVPGMGDRFKVIGVRQANVPKLIGFEPD